MHSIENSNHIWMNLLQLSVHVPCKPLNHKLLIWLWSCQIFPVLCDFISPIKNFFQNFRIWVIWSFGFFWCFLLRCFFFRTFLSVASDSTSMTSSSSSSSESSATSLEVDGFGTPFFENWNNQILNVLEYIFYLFFRKRTRHWSDDQHHNFKTLRIKIMILIIV